MKCTCNSNLAATIIAVIITVTAVVIVLVTEIAAAAVVVGEGAAAAPTAVVSLLLNERKRCLKRCFRNKREKEKKKDRGKEMKEPKPKMKEIYCLLSLFEQLGKLTLQSHTFRHLQGESQEKNMTSIQLQGCLQNVKLKQKHKDKH